jgi:NAD(P)-dependent dehydrogenase (short-subunit alcohol dehydrogenase family)
VTDERANAMKTQRVVVITGAAQGIGRVTAEQFSTAGYLVAAVDVQPQVADTADQLRARGGRAVHATFDVSDPRAVRDGLASVIDALGPIDVLVNNAGIVTNLAPVAVMAFEAWQRELGVNLTGAFNCIQAVLPAMVDRAFGRIINVSSIAAWGGLFRQAGYAATKAGLLGLTKTVALEHGASGITCNALLPGLTATERVLDMPDAIREHARAHIPAGRLGAMTEVASAAVFLASDEAAYINGAELPVDGGMHLSAASLASRRGRRSDER